MKLVALGISAGLVALSFAAAPASAFQKQGSVSLGAPLHAGPNVIILQTGHGDFRYGPSITLSGGGRIYGQPPPRRGYDHGHGYRWRSAPGHGYTPYNRYYRPYDPYRRDYGRGGRGYGRERYPNPNINPGRGYGGRGYGGYDNRGYGARNHSPRLTILGATYRSVDGRSCSAYAYAHRKCDGNQSCTVKASNSICGDPDRGRLKILDIAYSCGNQQFTSSTPEKSRSQIRCR